MSEEQKEKAKIRARKWYQNNKERARAAAKQRRDSRSEEQKEELKSYHKNYREQNKDKLTEKQKERYASNPGKKKLEDAKWRYGLTEENFKKIFEMQNKTCPICKKEWKNINDRDICVDHNHETNRVRGLLCNKCNMAIGNVKNTRKLSAYDKKYKEIQNG